MVITMIMYKYVTLKIKENFMFRGKKHLFILIIIGVVALYCLLNIYSTVQKNKYIEQIENIVVDCVKNHIDDKLINVEAGQKIYDSIQSNWNELGGIELEKVTCNGGDENWDEQYVCVKVHYEGIVGNGKEMENYEYYKIYFKTEGGKVYVLKVGVSVGETGIYDL